MNQISTWPPAGHWPLAPGKSVRLQPVNCGVVRVGQGPIAAGELLLQVGEALTLWRGDALDLVNVAASSPAYFSWDVCRTQPTRRENVRRWLARARGRVLARLTTKKDSL